MKLIKINEEHYIVVDDSEVRPGDYVYTSVTNKVVKFTDPRHFSDGTYFKIAHSTQPLAPIKELIEKGYDNILPLDIDEIKELIGEVDVEKKAETQLKLVDSVVCLTTTREEENIYIQGFYNGYNQSLEDNNEKKYTEEDIRKAILMARVRIENVSPKYSIDEIFLSLQPKTEWEVEIVDGKLKLK